MPGAAQIKLDTREFQRALKEIARTDKMELAFVLNDQGIRFCQSAIKLTGRANTGKIARELNRRQQTSTRIVGKSGKRLKRGTKQYARDTLAMRMVNSLRIRKGGKPIWGKNQSILKSLAEQFITTRQTSANFVRSGWISPIQDFLRAMGKAGRRREVGKAKVLGPPLGWARAATPGFSPVAWIANQAIIPKGKYSSRRGDPLKIGMEGARKAMIGRTADMKRKVEERLGRVHKKHSAK